MTTRKRVKAVKPVNAHALVDEYGDICWGTVRRTRRNVWRDWVGDGPEDDREYWKAKAQGFRVLPVTISPRGK